MKLNLVPDDDIITVTIQMTGKEINTLAGNMYNHKLLHLYHPYDDPFHHLVETYFLHLLQSDQLQKYKEYNVRFE